MSFAARKIRINKRGNINFNIIVSKTPDFSEQQVEQTVTLNFSKGGCYIISTSTWEINKEIWISIRELEDRAPITGKVRWGIEWGKYMNIPGIGVRFTNIKESQLDHICNKYRL
jgi:Tfp pilus assembly protein PilZ